MFALAVSFVALRKQVLYPAQVASPRESPAHRDALLLEALQSIRVSDLVTRGGRYATFSPATPAAEMLFVASDLPSQDVFPVMDAGGLLRGLVSADSLRLLAADREGTSWAVAADLMTAPVTVAPGDHLRRAADRLVSNGLRELPVVESDGRIVGFIDEAEIARVYLQAAARAEAAADSSVDTPRAATSPDIRDRNREPGP
jgi:CIC family chloride channel protein